MTEPESLLDRLRRLDKEATPGPWMHLDDAPDAARAYRAWIAASPGSVVIADVLTGDSELITALRNALPEIIEAFELLDGLFGMLPATAIVALHDHSAPVLESEHCVMCIWQRRHDDLLSKVREASE